MFSVGFAGTAKNTGKTTTLLYFLERAVLRQERVALTSIGCDGEKLDHITGLPKPRFYCPPGTVIATAQGTLTAGNTVFRELAQIPVFTPLGSLCLVEIVGGGHVVVVGPNKGSDLTKTLTVLRKLGCDLVLVDGAFGRLAPLVAVDGLVVSTGGARTRDITRLAEEMAAIEQVLSLPSRQEPVFESGRIEAIAPGCRQRSLDTGSLLSQGVADEVARLCHYSSLIWIPGPVEPGLLRDSLDNLGGEMAGKTFVFADPLKLILTGNFTQGADLLLQIKKGGGRVFVRKRVPLLGVSVNPFYPERGCGFFRPAWVDPGELKTVIAGGVQVPVIDVRRGCGGYYLDIIAQRLDLDGGRGRWE